jgi:hypothetical protein
MIIIFTQNRIGSNKIDMKMITQMKGVVLSSKYTSSEPTVSVSLPLKDSSALSAIFRRLIESIKKKLGLIK